MERQVLKISLRDKIRSSAIRKETGVTEIIVNIKQSGDRLKM